MGQAKEVGIFERAKTVKNVVCVNEEPTAEEWKRRLEREKEKFGRLKAKVEKLKAELYWWRINKLELKMERLYQQLNEKETENNQEIQYVENIKEKVKEQVELIASMRRDHEALQAEMNRIQQENESAKEEVKEVLH